MISQIILAGLLATQQPAPGPRIVEVPQPSEKTVTVVAYVKAPFAFGEREAAAWQVIGRCLLLGTSEFTANNIRTYAGQAGVMPKTVVMPDFIRVQLTVPSDGLDVGALFMESILRRPNLGMENFQRETDILKKEQFDAWRRAILPEVMDYSRLRPEHVTDLFELTFRPENINLVISGGFKPGDGFKAFDGRFDKYQPAPRRRAVQFDNPPRLASKHGQLLSTFELRGEAFAPGSPGSAAKSLAIFALGAGKDSSVFRVLREKERLSYRQEAFLFPTKNGWQPRILLIRKTKAGAETTAVQMQDALLKDVDSWSQETLDRANAMANLILKGDNSFGVVWLDGHEPMGLTSEEAAALRGFQLMTGGNIQTADQWAEQMQSVKLDELKAAAKAMLSNAAMVAIIGR